jgi:RNA polymerase sigma-70 factor (family 1)
MHSYKILSGFNKRDPAMVVWVWKHYYSYVFDIIGRLTKDSPDTMDMTSETLEKLLNHQEPFESMEKIRSFLLTIAKNKCTNYLNRPRIVETSTEDMEQLYKDIGTEDLIEAETIACLHTYIDDSIENLPRKCRHVFELYYNNGLKNREIAERLNISEKAVEKQKTKAFEILKMDIKPDGRFMYSIIFL